MSIKMAMVCPARFGFISEMCGKVKVKDTELNILGHDIQDVPTPLISGYRFAIYLPDGVTFALADPFPRQRGGDPAAATLEGEALGGICLARQQAAGSENIRHRPVR